MRLLRGSLFLYNESVINHLVQCRNFCEKQVGHADKWILAAIVAVCNIGIIEVAHEIWR